MFLRTNLPGNHFMTVAVGRSRNPENRLGDWIAHFGARGDAGHVDEILPALRQPWRIDQALSPGDRLPERNLRWLRRLRGTGGRCGWWNASRRESAG